MSHTERSRYAPAMLLAVVLAGTGAATGNPVALFAAVLPLSVVGFGALVAAPPESAVAVERRVSDHTPRPGDTVTVTLRVTNESERYLPDVRVIDGVPDPIAVVDGRPRGHCTLAPGETDEIDYDVQVPRGAVTFEPATVAVRSLAGTTERRTDAAGTDRLRVSVTAASLPSSDTAELAGRIETDDAGSGIAFHSSREYRPGDPINRIDWNRYASTGELSTVAFHEEKAATVVIVVDDRTSVRTIATPGERDAGQRGRAAAAELATALLSAGDRVGLAVKDSDGGFVQPRSGASEGVPPTEYRARGEGFLPPRGAGAAQETAIRRFLDHRDELPDALPLRREGFWFADELADHFDDDTQVILVSPLVDDEPVEAAEGWRARGHGVTVVSPDPTQPTVGGELERVRRRERKQTLRRVGAHVVDWDGTDRLETAVERTEVAR